MKAVFSFLLAATILASISLASKQDVYGICNQFNQEVRFENKESSGNNCNAPAKGVCYSSGKRAFVPKCESEKDFNNHRFVLHIGQMEYSIWKKDSDNKIYGGVRSDSSCRANTLAGYNQGNAWNIVIRPDASVYLVPQSQGCPADPATPNIWDPPQGEWKQIQSISGGDLSLQLSVGTSSTDSEAHTSTWTISLHTSISKNITFRNISVTPDMSYSIAKQVESSLTKSSETTQTFTCRSNGNTAVTMYQWIITAGHDGKKTTVANTPNVICVYGFDAKVPKCPVGACANLACNECRPWKRLGARIDDDITLEDELYN